MARYMLVLTFLMMSFLAFVQNGQAQNTPDARRQLNQDIQNQQRQIQERSREIEQRVQDQQREEERAPLGRVPVAVDVFFFFIFF